MLRTKLNVGWHLPLASLASSSTVSIFHHRGCPKQDIKPFVRLVLVVLLCQVLGVYYAKLLNTYEGMLRGIAGYILNDLDFSRISSPSKDREYTV